jgi:hypothetical protein
MNTNQCVFVYDMKIDQNKLTLGLLIYSKSNLKVFCHLSLKFKYEFIHVIKYYNDQWQRKCPLQCLKSPNASIIIQYYMESKYSISSTC